MKCPACGEDELEYGICFYCKHEVTDAERLEYLRENPEMDFDNELPALTVIVRYAAKMLRDEH